MSGSFQQPDEILAEVRQEFAWRLAMRPRVQGRYRAEDQYKAAVEAFGRDFPDYVETLMLQCLNDPAFIAEVDRLAADTPIEMQILSHVDYCKIIAEEFTSTKDVDAKVKLGRLLGEALGYVGANKTKSQPNHTSNVLLLNNNGNDDDWEAALVKQQEALTSGARPE